MTTTTSWSVPIRLGIIALTIATAIVHLYLGFQGLPLFVLNGLGYLALLAALCLPIPRLDPYRDAVSRKVSPGRIHGPHDRPLAPHDRRGQQRHRLHRQGC